MNLYIVHVDRCGFCGTEEYKYLSYEKEESGLHECTSGFSIHGGGACCAPIGHSVEEISEEEFNKLYK